MNATRVLVVGSSGASRALVRRCVQAEDIEVAGETRGEDVVSAMERARPDLVIVAAPSGLAVISEIMAARPAPILFATEVPAAPSDPAVVEATRRGALAVTTMPSADGRDAAALRAQVRALAGIPVVGRPKSDRKLEPARVERGARPPRARVPMRVSPHRAAVVGIAASAGGPPALVSILGALPRDFPMSIALVQHLPPGATRSFARLLAERTSLRVVIADEAVALEPGAAVLAPDDRHLVATRGTSLRSAGGALIASAAPPTSNGLRPAADVLFRSLAETYGPAAIGVVLTGIGGDGADGLASMRRAGAITIAQDEASSTVWGMPRAAVERGAAEHVLPLSAIGPALLALARGERCSV